MGSVINAIGFEAAKTVFALGLWVAWAFVLALLAREVGLSVASVAAGVAVFLLRQGILGNEWLFGTVEPKIFAYVAVVLAIVAALRGRWAAAMIATVFATYLHFLVGGFWAIALIALYLRKGGPAAGSLRLGALYAALVSPLLYMLLRERLGAAIGTAGIGLSLNQIYTEYSAHFHVAPLMDGWRGFFVDWLPGASAHVALLVS